jgi:hypothetical protein
MWESRAAFWHDFSKRRWESALFADFHGRGISIRQEFLLVNGSADLIVSPVAGFKWPPRSSLLYKLLANSSSVPPNSNNQNSYDMCPSQSE